MNWLAVAAVGAASGFLGGFFGRGGSALATPLLAAVGVAPLVAVAAPLPATIPSTLLAASVYRRERLLDPFVIRWSLTAGLPAVVIGALATPWLGGELLVRITDALVAILGVRVVVRRRDPDNTDRRRSAASRVRVLLVGTIVGLTSGMLANSGGFLLAPLYLGALNLPIRSAFANSLAVSGALAVPGVVTHALLGHLVWPVAAVLTLASAPLSVAGARVALATRPAGLERIFGGTLIVAGATFLTTR